jgi:hypothetical protein
MYETIKSRQPDITFYTLGKILSSLNCHSSRVDKNLILCYIISNFFPGLQKAAATSRAANAARLPHKPKHRREQSIKESTICDNDPLTCRVTNIALLFL